MINYRIIITQTFENDFKKLFNYISFINYKSSYLKILYNQIMNSIYSLEFLPERYAKIYNPSIGKDHSNLRKLLIDKYIIIYKVHSNTNEVFILHIFHSKQNYFNKL